jgi:DNA invertase Pin-like site-specific DNA recombinase
MGRALAYIRVSQEGGRGDDLISPQIQLDAIERHCEQHGHTIIETLEDIDLSGRFWKRRQTERAIQRIEAGEADVLVVWKQSRVSRNRVDWNIAVDRVEAAGGRIESATEPLDTTTSSGRFARGVLAELAAFESERIGETWKETHLNRVKRGLPHGGGKRFGYDTAKGGYTVNPEESAVLRQLYLDYCAGKGFSALVDLSGAHGGPTSDVGLKRMLDRGFGAGLLWVRGQHVAGAHEPVITAEEFERYQIARAKRAGRPRAESSPYPFSGLVVCWCGRKMNGNVYKDKRDGSSGYRYNCTAYRSSNGHTTTVSQRLVDAAVVEFLSGVADRINAGELEGSRRPARVDARPKIAADLAKTIVRLDALTVKYLDGDVSKDVYERLRGSLLDDRASYTSRLAQLDAQEQAASGGVQRMVPDLLRHWDIMPAVPKRAVLEKLVARIEVPAGGTRWDPKKLVVVPIWDDKA